MTPILLRVKAKIPTVVHKALHNLSPLSVSRVPLSLSDIQHISYQAYDTQQTAVTIFYADTCIVLYHLFRERC